MSSEERVNLRSSQRAKTGLLSAAALVALTFSASRLAAEEFPEPTPAREQPSPGATPEAPPKKSPKPKAPGIPDPWDLPARAPEPRAEFPAGPVEESTGTATPPPSKPLIESMGTQSPAGTTQPGAPETPTPASTAELPALPIADPLGGGSAPPLPSGPVSSGDDVWDQADWGDGTELAAQVSPAASRGASPQTTPPGEGSENGGLDGDDPWAEESL